MNNRLLITLTLYWLSVFTVYGTEEETKYVPESLEDLVIVIEDLLLEGNVPGAGIALVSRDEIIWSGGILNADYFADIPATENTLFRIGSISKSFVSIALLMLQERGLLNLNDRLSDIAPEVPFENPWEDTHPVRIEHLLEHTTGFDDLHFNEYALNDADIQLLDALTYNPASRVSRWKPGTFMSYCNAGPPIAAYVLEKVTGQLFEDFVQENILDVLEMPNASFLYTEKVKEHLSKGYSGDTYMEVPYWHIIMRPSGSLNASANDMAHFVQMLINRGSYKGKILLNPESILRMETPHTTLAARHGLKKGYGLGNYSSIDEGFVYHGHSGGMAGFIANLSYLPKQGLGYVVMINKAHGPTLEKIGESLGLFLTRDLEKPTPQPRVEVPVSQLESYTGWYEPATSRQQFMHYLTRLILIRQIILEDGNIHIKGISRIILEDGNILFKGLGKEGKEELIPVAPNLFRLKNQPVANAIYIHDEINNRNYFIHGWKNYNKMSSWFFWTQISVIVFCLIFIISSFLFSPVWLFRKLFGKLKGVTHLNVRVLPLLAVICLFLYSIYSILRIIAPDTLQILGNPTLISFSSYIFTYVFPLLSLAGLVQSIRSFSFEMHRGVKIHSFLVSIANTTVTLYLWYWGIIGLII